MNESTKRALRTLLQGVLALAVIAPVLVTVAPQSTALAAVASSVVAATALVSKVYNTLESKGVLPEFLKGADSVEDTVEAAVGSLLED